MTAALAAAVAAPAATSSVARKKKPVALVQGRYSTGAAYPAPFVSAGAQTAYDMQSITGYRPANLTKTRTGNAGELAALGWTTSTATWNRIMSTGAGATLEGWNTEGYEIWIKHSNCTVRDCLVDMTNYTGTTSGNPVWIGPGGETLTGTLIEYCEVNGGGDVNQFGAVQACVYEHAGGNASSTTLRRCYLHKSRGDGIQASGENILIEQNRVTIGGYWDGVTGSSPHCDLIQYTMGKATGVAGTIQDNWLDLTSNSGTYGRTSATTWNTRTGCTYRRNAVGIGASTSLGADEVQFRVPVMYSAISTTAGLAITNNVFDYRDLGGNGPMQGAGSVVGITSWLLNYEYADNSLISQPT